MPYGGGQAGTYDLSIPENTELKKFTAQKIGFELNENYTYKVNVSYEDKNIKTVRAPRKFDEGVDVTKTWDRNVLVSVEIFDKNGNLVGQSEDNLIRSIPMEKTRCDGCPQEKQGPGGPSGPDPGYDPDDIPEVGGENPWEPTGNYENSDTITAYDVEMYYLLGEEKNKNTGEVQYVREKIVTPGSGDTTNVEN